VLVDSVQSQANRLEEALLTAVREKAIALPYVTVDFRQAQLAGLTEITSLDAQHRVYDASGAAPSREQAEDMLRGYRISLSIGAEQARDRHHQAALLTAVALGRRRPDLADATIAAHRRRLERELERLLARKPTDAEGRKLRDAVALDCRDKLLVFLKRRDAEPTNNASERALWPSVIFRNYAERTIMRSGPSPILRPALLLTA
jgi:hypothetical protein